MSIQRRAIALAGIIIGAVWIASSFDYIQLTPIAFSSVRAGFLLLSGLGVVMDWRSRSERPIKEPTPAQSARNVILLTGLAAVLVSALP